MDSNDTDYNPVVEGLSEFAKDALTYSAQEPSKLRDSWWLRWLKFATIIIFPAVVFLALTAATLFRTITPVKRWWFPFAPLIFIGGGGVLAALLLLHNPGAALLGAGIVLFGLPMRWMLTRRGSVAGTATDEDRALISEP